MAILKDLIVHGSSRFLNKIYASEIQTPLIEAETGIFKKLKADDATVVGLLDVKGQLHTNNWSNSNIATIDGSFYITPTIGSDSGTVTITATSLNFSGTNYAVTSLYLGDNSSITWPQYSKVLVTGQILSNGEWIPLGTLLGQLSNAATATSISINSIKDNKKQDSNVLATLVSNGTTNSDYRNLKVSLYQRATSSTDFRPLGIYMTATGTNGRTFLDIYGGVESLSNSNNYGGFADPNVRIGNLQGLPSVGGQTPKGWGIYTDNGYFKGIIAADQGYIGSGSRYWVIANYEDGSNPNNSRSYIYNNTDSVTSTVEGIYLGTDGIRNYKDSTHYVTIKDGVITALGVNLTGQINATAGNIGGAIITGGVLTVPAAKISGQLTAATIDASKINSGDISSDRITTNVLTALQAKLTSLNTNNLSAITANLGTITTGVIKHDTVGGTNGIWLSADTNTSSNITVGESTARKDWRLLVNNKFGVTKTGDLYASSANISGTITATSGTIGGIRIVNGDLEVSSISIGSLNGASNYAQKSYVDNAVNDIEIGGRNLLKGSNIVNTSLSNSVIGGTATQTVPSGTVITLSVQVDADNVVWSSSGNKRIGVASSIVKDGGGNQYIEAWAAMTGRTGTGIDKTFDTSFHGRVKSTYTLQGELPLDKVFTLHIQSVTSGTVSVSNPKLEIGNKATDWTPAPEDTQESINNAAKTATSYITYINANDGIKVHNAQDTLNYLQLNSTAISMFRNRGDGINNDEVLRIEDNEVRIGKINGNNVFIDNTSVNIKKGQNTLAFFGVDGMQIGLNNETRTEQDYHSWKMIDKDGNIYAFVSDLRDENGEATITEIAKLSTPSTEWGWAETNFDIDSIISLTVDGEVPDIYAKVLPTQIKIQPIPPENAVVVVTYTSQSPELKAYTFGKRYSNSSIGGYSFAEGVNCTSSGYSSHAEGVACTSSRQGSHAEGSNCTASGQGSHAEGILTTASGRGSHAQNFETTASSMYQTTIGKYNIDDANNKYAFIIGNGGFDQPNRTYRYSNAFTVDWDGNTEIAGNLNVGALTVNTRKPFLIVQKTYTRTITANSACYISQQYVSPTGYISVGIIDWGTFNGTYADYCVMGHAYVWRGNPNTIDIYVWNQHPSQSATNVVIFVNILCIADTFL